MIDSNRITNLLEKYSKTDSCKKKVERCISTARKSGKRLADGSIVASEEDMYMLANVLADIIRQRIPDQLSSTAATLKAGRPIKNPDGSYQVVLSFDSRALHRDSLENDLGYDGIDNIVALFNNGYHAQNYVYGWWNGHSPTQSALSRSGLSDQFAWVRSKKEREALLFMQDAEAEFNARYGDKYGVEVRLGSDYTKD